MSQNSRQLAFLALREIQRGAFADVALDTILRQTTLPSLDKRLLTELVYGTIRRQRTLDVLIDQLGKKKSQQQPPDLRLILHLGLYQLRYLTHIPASAAVNTTVELAKYNGFTGLAGVVNGILRQYHRLTSASNTPDPLLLPSSSTQQLGILHSYPDWIVDVWLQQFGQSETEQLCRWMNQSPSIDLRVNRLRTTVTEVEAAMQAAGIKVVRVPPLPDALRLVEHVGRIQDLPGFQEGWWMVQDCSAQLVSHLLDPQPGEIVIDACAAPGGKTTHIAELMNDTGTIWACDKTPSRLKKLQQNCDRLQLHSIRIYVGDSRTLSQFHQQADRVLVDAPCSGLGTLHRHADARWRQTPNSIAELTPLQTGLLAQAASWVKPGGVLVYATCTLHPAENEHVIRQFLATHPAWKLVAPDASSVAIAFTTADGWVKVLPHQHSMDGFFMARLEQQDLLKP
ncbi:MAG: 16S rRNA (cytosine(967)-C(5))-methyltransferase [Oscillatoriales cyanobacterium C42_A2020_001]|nr:16S rRNA (cytosine(967)-C(5))-methyltransferase [Leptolyngbyaceae cyanobacterium C42_A2020_001]